jgi:glycosyltransferase involved in cell wall biosynthesis
MEKSAPRISVIIPTLGRPQALQACLEALHGSDYKRDRFEIIVVDDGNPAPLDRVVHPFAEQLDIKMLKQKNGGPASARNAGAEIARGELLAFTDDDCLPESGWLAALDHRHSAAPAHLIGGRTVNALSQNAYSAASQLVTDFVYSHYNADPERALFFASNNMAVPRQRFLEIGGFDLRFRTAEDRELCDRWRHAGLCLSYAPDAAVRHSHDLRLSTFLHQHFSYGRGALHYHRIRAFRKSGKIAQEFTFYQSLPLRIRKSLAGKSALPAGKLLLLLLLWQLANAAGYCREFMRPHRFRGDS